MDHIHVKSEYNLDTLKNCISNSLGCWRQKETTIQMVYLPHGPGDGPKNEAVQLCASYPNKFIQVNRSVA